ncbi:MAG: hypothetical protein N2110_04645 [Flavobacteriales bacterium]|nr:hypothetical protein [Flavobacteriales bacterium]MCX7768298.1 hypothetical protein [Flavobacteriales bacterium]MDW8409926.1 hypothetical protein [Flavobacteriales bacterium]
MGPTAYHATPNKYPENSGLSRCGFGTYFSPTQICFKMQKNFLNIKTNSGFVNSSEFQKALIFIFQRKIISNNPFIDQNTKNYGRN